MERFCKNSLRLLAVDYFCRKAPSYIFDWVLNTPLRVTNIITVIRCKTMSRESSQENNCVRVSFYQINFLFHFIKKRLQDRCFPVNIAKFLRTTILNNIRDGCFWKQFHHWLWYQYSRNKTYTTFTLMQTFQDFSGQRSHLHAINCFGLGKSLMKTEQNESVTHNGKTFCGFMWKLSNVQSGPKKAPYFVKKRPMQERFWQEQCTWWKNNSAFVGQISEDRKCGRCPQRPISFIVRHSSWEYSEFLGTP